MAAAGQDILSLLSEDFLSCEVCQEHFDADARTPRILPCHHTFCGSCLRQLGQDGHLTCPKCRVSIKVEASFPTDTTRVHLLDLVKARDQEGQTCQGCEEGAKAMTRCQECEEFLCVDCTRAHQTVKVTRNHKLKVLSQAAQPPAVQPPAVQKATTPTKDPELCSQHQDEKLKWFCGKCTKTACSTCAMTMHKGCRNVVELSSIVDEKKKKVLALCEKLSGLGKIFRQKAEESEASSEVVDQRLQEGIQQAEQTFSDIVSTAMDRQAEVIQDLRIAAKADHFSLEEESTTFRSLQAAAETSAEKGRQVVSLELTARIVEQECQLEKTAADLGQKTTATVKAVPTYQVGAEQVDQVKTMIQNIGRKEAAAPVRKPSDRLSARRSKPPPVVETSATEVPPRVSVSEAPAPPTERNTNYASTLQTELEDQDDSSILSSFTLADYSVPDRPPQKSTRKPCSDYTTLTPFAAKLAATLRDHAVPNRSPSPSRPPRMPHSEYLTMMPSAAKSAAKLQDHTVSDRSQSPSRPPRMPHSEYLTMMPSAAKSAAILRGSGNSLIMGTTVPKTAEAFHRDSVDANPDEQGEHPGVTCNMCRGRVCGNRYRCLQCPNFNLCEDCERRHAHPYHSFLKIVKPWRAGNGQRLMQIFMQLDPPISGPQSDGQVHMISCDGCDDKMVGARYVCLECPDCDLCQKCETLQKHPPHTLLKLIAPWDARKVSVFMEQFQKIVQG